MIKIMKTMNYKHDALINYDPKTGEYNEELNHEGIIRVPAAYQVCPDCNGHGHHFRSDLDENHLLDLMEEDGDYEGIQSYYVGKYDQVCNNCDGQRVVLEYKLPEWADKLVYEWYREESLSRRIAAAERRMGA